MKTRLTVLLVAALFAQTALAVAPEALLARMEKSKGPDGIERVKSSFAELVAKHPRSPELEAACTKLLFHSPRIAVPLLDRALKAKLPRNTEVVARYVRARAMLDGYNDVPPPRREALAATVRKQTNELVKRFPDVKLWEQTIGHVAKRMLYELDHLMPGKPAPQVFGVDLDGKPLALASFRGQVVALSFWGAWCPPCVAALPGERKFLDSMKGKPFALVGVNTDVEKAAGIKIAKKQGVTWRSFWDKDQEGPISTAYAVSSFPTVYVIDKKGIIRHRNIPPDEELLRACVTPLLAE